MNIFRRKRREKPVVADFATVTPNSNSVPFSAMDPKALFDQYDTDGSGTICFDEFQIMLPSLGVNISTPRMAKYFKACDTDNSGEIDFEEFKVALYVCDPDSGNSLGFSPHALVTPQDAFDYFDKDGSGKLDEDEFHYLLEYLGLDVNDETQEKMFKKYDKDKSGFIEYPEFKKVWLTVANTKRELLDRNIVFSKFSTNTQLVRLLQRVLDEEEEWEQRVFVEAEKWKKWLHDNRQKQKDIERARTRADNELAAALDSGGQVYVFGEGTYGQFSHPTKSSDSGGAYFQEGFDRMQDIWRKRTRSCVRVNGEKYCEHGHEKESSFHGTNTNPNTVRLWGHRPEKLAISSNVIFALTESGEIFAWGGTSNFWKEIEPDSHWQSHWPGETTPRSKKLLSTDGISYPSITKTGDESEVVREAELLKLMTVIRYHEKWESLEGSDNLLLMVKQSLVPKLVYEELQMTLQIRGKQSQGMTKYEMIDIIYGDLEFERGEFGERFQQKIREYEIEILNLKKRDKSSKMAKRLLQEINKAWEPLNELQLEARRRESSEKLQKELEESQKLEDRYLQWRQNDRVCESFADSGKVGEFQINGITERGATIESSRDHAKCKGIFAGANHAALIHRNGSVYMWGIGNSGRLGFSGTDVGLKSNNVDVSTPTLVKALLGYSVLVVSCGHSHTAAICSTGDLFVWGNASAGKLGLGDLVKHRECFCSAPTRLTIPYCRRILRVSCGANHTACIGEGGQLFVWGCADGGRLGIGRQGTSQYSPFLVESLKNEIVSDVSCGNFQTIAITALKEELIGEGQMKIKVCTGGKLFVAGPASVLGKFCPSFESYESLQDIPIRQVSAGFLHQVCVTIDGELFSWGSNVQGCCGHDVVNDFISQPQRVACLHKKPKNLALRKASVQSSVFGGHDAHLAVNGNIDGKEGNIIHTQVDYEPFFEVDLGRLATIVEIKLWNRTDVPNDLTIDRDKFSKRLFPCWIMISKKPFQKTTEGRGNLNESLEICTAKCRFTEDKRLTCWKLPGRTIGKYIRVQLEGFEILHFAQLEVYGYDIHHESLGQVSQAVAGKNVSAIVISASKEPRDIETCFDFAIAADAHSENILRHLDYYAGRYTNFVEKRKATSDGSECALCISDGKMCEICELKSVYKEELKCFFAEDSSSTYTTKTLDEISRHLLDPACSKVFRNSTSSDQVNDNNL